MTPNLPYYAVIFTFIYTNKIDDNYYELNYSLMDKISKL